MVYVDRIGILGTLGTTAGPHTCFVVVGLCLSV